ncbi:MAG: sulfate respiration complex hexadecaheme cytochrome HmcA [Desulfobacterales bacterium]
MERGKRIWKWTGMVAAGAFVLLVGAGAYGVTPPGGPELTKRADIVTIDDMQKFGHLERPPVLFLHDQHTQTLKAEGKDCSACHLKDEKGRMSRKFKRLEDTDPTLVMNAYHDNCIACHTEVQAAGRKSGPVTCGECHVKSPGVVSDRQPIQLDKSLHYRHLKAAKAEEKDCGLCHHAYNEQTQALFYDKGKEGSCRYCHKEVTEENRISMREAAHMDCVSCHQETVARQKDAGPIECAGCHSTDAQMAVAVVENVPRMERNQPDQVFVKAGKDVQVRNGSSPLRANAVPFDHLKHEQYNDTCISCHHASLDSCNNCHTLAGHKDGDFVKLADAMHVIGDNASCIGCHAASQKDPKCAGCHAFMETARQQEVTSACRQCHMEAAPPAGELTGSDAEKMMAAALLDARTPVSGTYPDAEIPEKTLIDQVHMPETVKIDQLSTAYEAVEMPHRKVVKSLVEKIGDNKLAANFHPDPGSICQGCHHHSPVSRKPPQCASCHGALSDEKNLHAPGLLGAYHRQCMGCHEQMELTKLNECSACHKDKK